MSGLADAHGIATSTGSRAALEASDIALWRMLSFYGTQRFWFWVCVVFIAIGGVAIAANLMEPSRASF